MHLRQKTKAVWWWLAAAATLATIAFGFGSVGSGLLPGDREGLILAKAMRSSWLDAVFQSLTWFGSLIVLLPLATMAGVLLWRRGHRVEAQFLVGALIGASMFAQLVKNLVERPRPDLFPALVQVVSPLSFPSEHATQSTAFAVAVLLISLRLRPNEWTRAAPVLAALVLLVDFSRIYLQVHYPSDVLAGSIAAACWVMGLRVFMFGGGESHG